MTSKPFTIHPFACSFRSEIYKNLFGVSIISFRKEGLPSEAGRTQISNI